MLYWHYFMIKIGNLKKKEYYLNKLEQIDKDNPLFETKIENKDKETDIIVKKVKKNKILFHI